MNNNKIFTETQSFSQKWVFYILGILLFYLFIAFYCQAVQHISFGKYSMTNKSYISTIILVLIPTIFMVTAKLHTRIDEQGISYKFATLQFKYKIYSWDDIEDSFVRSYSPLGEFGGWGYRISPNGTAITTTGVIGIQIKTKKGKNILLGTGKGAEATAAIADFRKQQS